MVTHRTLLRRVFDLKRYSYGTSLLERFCVFFGKYWKGDPDVNRVFFPQYPINGLCLFPYSTPISPINAQKVLGSWETLYSFTFRGVVLDALGVILASPRTERALENGPF